MSKGIPSITKPASQPKKGGPRCQYEQPQTAGTPRDFHKNTDQGKTYERSIKLTDTK